MKEKMKRHTSKIIALSLALLMTLMTVVPAQAGLGFAFAGTEEAAEQAEESAETVPDEIYDLEDSDTPQESGEAVQESKDSDKERENEGRGDSADVKKDVTGQKDSDGEGTEDASAKDAASSIEFKGKEFDVTIDSTPEAGLPAGTDLKVTEITGKDKEFEDYYKTAVETVKDDVAKNDTRTVRFARFYDFELKADGKALEPEDAVNVTIDYSKAIEDGKAESADKKENVKILHFTENEKTGKLEAEVLDRKVTDATIENTALTEAKFEAKSFSVYAVVYTVDFHYGDGQYDFSIAGESSIMLSEIIERLHIGDLTTGDVKAVKFSDPDLIKVEKKSAALDAEDGTVPADDWQLTSLKPFSTDETLTLTLNDGEEVVVKVTDAPTTDPNGYVAYIVNGNQRQGYSTLEAAFDALPTNQARTIELTGDCIVNSSLKYEGNSDSRTLTIKPAAGVTNPVIYRGEETGDLITLDRGYMVIQGVTIDGSSVAATGALLKSTKETNRITLTDVIVQNHKASNASCAVEASLATYLYLSGSTKIIGNTSSAGDANLHIPNKADRTNVTGTLTEDIGITSSNNSGGEQFALLYEDKALGLTHFKADNSNLLRPYRNAKKIKWAAVSSYYSVGNGTERTIQYDSTYGKITTPSSHANPSINIPLVKTVDSNIGKNQTAQALEDTVFHFNVTCSPSDGAKIEPNEQFELSAADIINNGTASSNRITLTLDGGESPWTVTFSKKGTYTVTVSEVSSDKEGIQTDSSVKTLTYHVVEEAGQLRLAESFKEEGSEEAANTDNGTKLNEVELGGLFTTKGTSDRKVSVKTDANNKHKITMEIGGNTGGAVTPKFTFDFSRSFKISGHLTTPDSDGIGFAFHNNPEKNAYRYQCNNGMDDINYHSWGDDILGHLISGYSPSDNEIKKGFMVNLMTRDLNKTQGIFAYGILGNQRIPYKVSSGLNNDSYWLFNDAYEDTIGYGSSNYSPFSIEFICTDPTIGAGVLKFEVFGQKFEFNDFVASSVLGSDVWQNAYFTLSGSVEAGTCTLYLENEEYTEKMKDVKTSFWADRNGDNAFETQVNTTNSPALPGETILVRHEFLRDDNENSIFFEKVLIRELKDITDGTKLSGSDAHSYPEGAPSDSIRCIGGSFNSDEVTDAMRVAVFQKGNGNKKTVFEYKVTAPNKNNHIVTEQTVFGQEPFLTIYTGPYGFRTEKNLTCETPTFTNNVSVSTLTFDPAGGSFADNSTVNKQITVLNGSDYEFKDTPVKANHFFKGWKSGDNTYQVGETVTVDGDMTFTAQWEKAIRLTVKEMNTDGAVVPGSKFTLNGEGCNLTLEDDDDDGTIIIPRGTGTDECPFENGKTYTLTQTAAANNYAVPGFSWTLTVDNNGVITATDNTQSDSAELATKVRSLGMAKNTDGSFEVYNEPYNILVLKNNTDAVYNLTEVFGNNGSVFRMNGTGNTDWAARPATVAANGGEVSLAIINKAENATGNRFNLKGTFAAHEGDVIKATMEGQTIPASPADITITKGEDGQWSTYHGDGSEKNVSANLGAAGNTVTVTFTLDSYYTYLKVTKVLPGDYDNRSASYTFTLSGLPNGVKAYKVNGTAEEELAGNTFTLKHDQNVVLRVPANTELTVTETPVEGYGVEIDDNGVQSPSESLSTPSEAKVQVTLKARYTAESPAFVIFKNSLTSPVVPSGLKIAGGILAFALIIVFAAFYAVAARRRRSA